jgi:hypothetical protein
VERLKAVAALFEAHDGDLTLGAFAGVKESMLAQWSDEGRLRVLGPEDGPPVAAWLERTAGSSRAVRDFRGQVVGEIGRGQLQIQRMAAAPGWGWLLREALAGASWAEIWQEHPVERWAVLAAGLGWRGTKVRASSELVGVWGPQLPEGTLPYPEHDYYGLIQLELPFDPARTLAEAREAQLHWADHYAVYNKRHSWSAIALRGFGGLPEFIIKPSEMSKQWKRENPQQMGWRCEDTPLLERFPSVGLLLALLPAGAQRVRLMRLAPGDGELTRHADITDHEAGTAPGRLLRLHLPLVTNPQVQFCSWLPDGSVQTAHMEAGECWSLDTRKPHTAWNWGESERIHLVIDAWSHPDLLARMAGAGEIVRQIVPEPQQPCAIPPAWPLR